MRLPTRNAEGIGALVKLLAPNTQARVTPHWPQRIALAQPASLSRSHPVSLSQGTPLGSVGRDANSQLHLLLFTKDPGEARGWLPGGQLREDLLVLLRVYLGWRSNARLQLSLPLHCLPRPVLGGPPLLLGMTGVLGLDAPDRQATRQGTITINLGRYQGLRSNTRTKEALRVAYRF
ncbi:type VI secretion protein [compost metagenome]